MAELVNEVLAPSRELELNAVVSHRRIETNVSGSRSSSYARYIERWTSGSFDVVCSHSGGYDHFSGCSTFGRSDKQTGIASTADGSVTVCDDFSICDSPDGGEC